MEGGNSVTSSTINITWIVSYLKIPLFPVYTSCTCLLAGNIVTILSVLAAISAGLLAVLAPTK